MSGGDPIHLRPTAELAERVLLPGDPGRALALAQALLEQPLMFNHHRGLWGYTGTAPDGEPLTIQATGMGGPSAAIVFSELIALGAKRAIRVGTCEGRRPSAAQALAIEMEAAALFAVGAAARLPVACVLAVSDTFDAGGGRHRIEDPALLAASERMGAVAAAALSD